MNKNIIYHEIYPSYTVIYNPATKETLLSKSNASNMKDINLSSLFNTQERLNSVFDARSYFSTIVINITESCNLRCRYCSRYKEHYNKDKVISDSILYTILEKAVNHSNILGEKVVVQFHGGEPLLFFNKIKNIVKELSNEDRSQLDLRVQTNGTLLNEYILEFCRKYNIHIGISIDGPPEINAINRKFASGEPIENILKDNLLKIKKYIHRNHISCLSVLSQANVNDAEKIMTYISENGIDDVSILPIYPDFTNCINTSDHIIPRTEKMVSFSSKVFDIWINRLKNEQFISIPNFQIWFWNLLGKNANYITNNTSCGVAQTMVFIDTDGNIYPCGPFSYDKNMSFGNIMDMELDDIRNTHLFKQFEDRDTINVAECSECVLQGICLGGCPANSYLISKSIFAKDPFCDYWKGVIVHILKRIIDEPEICELIPEFSIRL